ncbi:hemopexin repeat-containing protein [Streptomyces sp. FXJ1.172]|uniref:hemopexin repeat-containing protein n=1 Tax=Streptomyces sp. FXJ1.172 TaxID=710705 RepID=UPI0007D02E23|nr:hemopexin repeat-containing protein [Streptomyces sp. FXJ1.172]WEO92972.1 hemopexin repeat-containing protein [Streptomyces sp. FXJ1.172]
MAQARTVFFFRGGTHVRYEIDPVTGAETVNHDIYPRALAEAWTAMPTSFTHGIDAALTWPDGYVYFFKGSSYLNYDIQNSAVRPGYRRVWTGPKDPPPDSFRRSSWSAPTPMPCTGSTTRTTSPRRP